MMTSKERMLVALGRGKPDRLPVTIHQWQGYHLRTFMGGVDQLTAFRQVGLDASFMAGNTRRDKSPNWLYRNASAGMQGNEKLTRHTVETPEGELTWLSGSNDYTTYNIEHIIKTEWPIEVRGAVDARQSPAAADKFQQVGPPLGIGTWVAAVVVHDYSIELEEPFTVKERRIVTERG